MNELVKKINKNQIALAFAYLFLLTLSKSVSSYFRGVSKRPNGGRFLIAGRDRVLITPKPYIPPGVLNSEQVKDLAQEGVLHNASLESIEPDSSSIDLHLSNKGWKLSGSLKQIENKDDLRSCGVESACKEYKDKELNLTPTGELLKKGNVYVFLLEESVDFSIFPFLYGEATGKSSIGRIDVLTRLLADGLPSYDYIEPPYEGQLYIEIIPISFDVKVYPGDSLNQLRFHCGKKQPLDQVALVGWRLLFSYEGDNLKFADIAQREQTLSINLEPTDWGGQKIVALKANSVNHPIDFAVAKEDKQNRLDPCKYFDPIKSDKLELLIRALFKYCRNDIILSYVK